MLGSQPLTHEQRRILPPFDGSVALDAVGRQVPRGLGVRRLPLGAFPDLHGHARPEVRHGRGR